MRRRGHLFPAGRTPCDDPSATKRSFALIIATWNVNSVRQRLPHLLDYLKEVAPDVLCLQEIKCQDEAFPREEIEALGYNVADPRAEEASTASPSCRSSRWKSSAACPATRATCSRAISRRCIPWGKRVVRLASLYLPNGNPVGTEKYDYKLAFMDRLIRHARKLLRLRGAARVAGDYNVIPERATPRIPSNWTGDALFLPQTRAKFRELLALGLTDALRATTDAGGLYTFWDYQAGAWQRNNGIRIDHLLLSPQAADRLASVTIDKDMRAREKASDHVPIRVALRD